MNVITPKKALVIGASRNLGLGLAGELARRGWDVVGTVRSSARTGLHELAENSAGRVTIEHVDTTDPDGIRGLHDRLVGSEFDLLLINAGITDEDKAIRYVSTDTFTQVMITNALGPMRVIETLGPLVTSHGTIAVMSSRQGSVSLNTRGGHEVYRASKSALNQLMRSYAARATESRTLLLLHPGWVQTELGGPGAQLTVDDSVPGLVGTIERHTGEPGLQFRDFRDAVVPW